MIRPTHIQYEENAKNLNSQELPIAIARAPIVEQPVVRSAVSSIHKSRGSKEPRCNAAPYSINGIDNIVYFQLDKKARPTYVHPP